MKTEKEWMQVFGHAKTDSMTVSVDPPISLPEKTVVVLYPEDIKRIQLDALREAAEIADNEQLADMAEGNIATQAVIVKAILTRIKEVEIL